MSESRSLSDGIRRRAAELGFDLVGIAPAVSPPGYHRLVEWLSAGYAAEMRWIERRKEAYQTADGVLPGTRSVIMVAMNYHEGSQHAAGARVSRYAWGTADYHDLMRERLKLLADDIHKLRPTARSRVVVDTAPLLERDFARLAGIGWFGKNTMLISRQIGSWFFLGAVLTDVELDYDQPHQTDHCGSCTRCLDACPTDAFPEPGVLDANRCISYLTIEHRQAPIPDALRSSIGPWLFGCDICQDVCPWNRFAPESSESVFQPFLDRNPVDCRALLRMDATQFREHFAKTPLLRPGRAGLLRNAAIVLGNLRCIEAEPELTAALNDPESLIRGAAVWALGQLELPGLRVILQDHLVQEIDEDVRFEIESVLKIQSPAH